MSIKKTMNTSTDNYYSKIEQIKNKLANSEALVVGIGSGLSAACGLNYADPELVKKWFPEYYAQGHRSLFSIQGTYWRLQDSNPTFYWGYWARHIQHIRYETPLLSGYQNLAKLLQAKNYFIYTTNADGQIQKTALDSNKIFAPQGNYAYFQCIIPCRQEIYPNQELVAKMIANMPTPFEISPADIPHCPHCGNYLVPNLRCDQTFVETPHLKLQPAYQAFLKSSQNQTTVFLELGVGYNTPGIIRFPFEALTQENPKASLIRINLTDADVPAYLEAQSIALSDNLAQVLKDLA